MRLMLPPVSSNFFEDVFALCGFADFLEAGEAVEAAVGAAAGGMQGDVAGVDADLGAEDRDALEQVFSSQTLPRRWCSESMR